MASRKASVTDSIKQTLINRLLDEHAFWSHPSENITVDTLADDQLIAMTMRHLDLDDIKLLFSVYTVKKIKEAWKQLLVPEGEYLYTLNRFFAWYYFKAKRPDAYLKSLETRHLNSLLSHP